jgi:hypothetical protein
MNVVFVDVLFDCAEIPPTVTAAKDCRPPILSKTLCGCLAGGRESFRAVSFDDILFMLRPRFLCCL